MSSIRLGEIGKISMCKRILKSQTNEFSGIPFYKISTFGGTPTVYIDEKIYREYKEKYSYPKKGDILISAAGTIGKTVIFDGEDSYFQDSNIVWIENDESKVTNQFLYYFLQTNPFITTNGSTIKRLYNDNLRDTKIPNVPSIQQQNQITDILGTLDKKIQTNNQINQELEAMAKTLYDYWFVQFDFPDQNGKPYKSSGGKMVYNPELKREIPEGWGVDSLWNIANFYNGLAMQKYRPDTNEDDYLPVIKIREMMNGFSKDTERARLDIPSEAVVDRGDILFSWSATLEVIIWGKEKGALNQHIFKVTSDTYPKSFIYFELKSYLKVFKAIAELRKTTMGHITQDHLKQAKIVVPPIELISKLDAKLQPIMLKQQILENQNQELTQLRDWLLPMLMNGQVKVE
ncbi:MAG: restriction endonuclease subunit S [Streptococcus thermophilus]|nr:restriction endonuclease subunit S [Streptococcus thermophilus]MCE2090636.1 restriction endonuclease subunit S [Streptococcus thermophilus]